MTGQFIRPADGPYAGVALPIVGIVDGAVYVRIGDHDPTLYVVPPHPDHEILDRRPDDAPTP